MNATWAVSASDAVLAAVALWVCIGFSKTSPIPPLRMAAISGSLLIASAALVGCMRFAGSASLLPLHTALSNQGAVIGLPLILVAAASARLGKYSSERISAAAATLLLVVIAATQSRNVSATASFLLVLATIVLSRHHRTVPLLMLLCLGALAALAKTDALQNEWRLVLLHSVLAVLLPLSLATMQRTGLREAEPVDAHRKMNI